MTIATNVSAGADLFRWKTPTPYLFGGLSLVLGLVAVALLVLACAEIKHTDDEGDAREGVAVTVKDDGPKIVVILAGDEYPTFLANPVPILPARASPPHSAAAGDELV